MFIRVYLYIYLNNLKNHKNTRIKDITLKEDVFYKKLYLFLIAILCDNIDLIKRITMPEYNLITGVAFFFAEVVDFNKNLSKNKILARIKNLLENNNVFENLVYSKNLLQFGDDEYFLDCRCVENLDIHEVSFSSKDLYHPLQILDNIQGSEYFLSHVNNGYYVPPKKMNSNEITSNSDFRFSRLNNIENYADFRKQDVEVSYISENYKTPKKIMYHSDTLINPRAYSNNFHIGTHSNHCKCCYYNNCNNYINSTHCCNNFYNNCVDKNLNRNVCTCYKNNVNIHHDFSMEGNNFNSIPINNNNDYNYNINTDKNSTITNKHNSHNDETSFFRLTQPKYNSSKRTQFTPKTNTLINTASENAGKVNYDLIDEIIINPMPVKTIKNEQAIKNELLTERDANNSIKTEPTNFLNF